MEAHNEVSRDLLKTLHRLCTTAGVRYAILGGAACFALGSGRTTQDVDIVVSTGTGSGQDIDAVIDALVRSSEGRFTKHIDQYGVPLLKLDNVEIEIFDPIAWPHRPQYSEFLRNDGCIYIADGNEGFVVVSPPLLLREKLITFEERKRRAVSDLADIFFLFSYCRREGLTIDLRGDDPVSVSARKGLSEYDNAGGEVYTDVVFL